MAQAMAAAIGGLVIVVLLVRFVRFLWRKPADGPGSRDPLGGIPTGGPDGDSHGY